jgi:ubiquitin-protein ligase
MTELNNFNNKPTEPIFISKDAMKRIISDVKDLRKNPLTEHGIYYEHDDTDILKGTALIIGPRDTPYENGFYLFKIAFPSDYPHAPPVVTFCTADGKTRFNPNLYRSGKVCVSILNTWKGEQWSACQTVSSILLSICTLLSNDPLLNEPGITKTHHDFNRYTDIIRYKNILVAVFGVLNDEKYLNDFSKFMPIMREHFQKEKETIRAKVELLSLAQDRKTIMVRTGIYKLKSCINYESLLQRFITEV